MGESGMNRMYASEYRGNEFATAWQPDIGSQSDGACLTVPGSPRRVANGLGEELASAAATYGAFEWVALGYLAISSARSEEHTPELQSPDHLVCRLLLQKKKTTTTPRPKP